MGIGWNRYNTIFFLGINMSKTPRFFFSGSLEYRSYFTQYWVYPHLPGTIVESRGIWVIFLFVVSLVVFQPLDAHKSLVLTIRAETPPVRNNMVCMWIWTATISGWLINTMSNMPCFTCQNFSHKADQGPELDDMNIYTRHDIWLKSGIHGFFFLNHKPTQWSN